MRLLPTRAVQTEQRRAQAAPQKPRPDPTVAGTVPAQTARAQGVPPQVPAVAAARRKDWSTRTRRVGDTAPRSRCRRLRSEVPPRPTPGSRECVGKQSRPSLLRNAESTIPKSSRNGLQTGSGLAGSVIFACRPHPEMTSSRPLVPTPPDHAVSRIGASGPADTGADALRCSAAASISRTNRRRERRTHSRKRAPFPEPRGRASCKRSMSN